MGLRTLITNVSNWFDERSKRSEEYWANERKSLGELTDEGLEGFIVSVSAARNVPTLGMVDFPVIVSEHEQIAREILAQRARTRTVH